jgi:hypothetical protein
MPIKVQAIGLLTAPANTAINPNPANKSIGEPLITAKNSF